MKKRFVLTGLIFAAAAASAVFSGCSAGNKEPDPAEAGTQAQREMPADNPQAGTAETAAVPASKTLIVYFDHSENINTDGLDVDAVTSASMSAEATKQNTGKLRMLVDEIRNAKSAETFSIQVNEPYAPKYDDMVGQAKQDIAANKSFTFKTELKGLDDYGTVYFVTPIWWGELPQPVHVFFRQCDFSGKAIVPVILHRGSGFGRTVSQIREYEPDAAVADGIAIEADIDNSKAKAKFDRFLESN